MMASSLTCECPAPCIIGHPASYVTLPSCLTTLFSHKLVRDSKITVIDDYNDITLIEAIVDDIKDELKNVREQEAKYEAYETKLDEYGQKITAFRVSYSQIVLASVSVVVVVVVVVVASVVVASVVVAWWWWWWWWRWWWWWWWRQWWWWWWWWW